MSVFIVKSEMQQLYQLFDDVHWRYAISEVCTRMRILNPLLLMNIPRGFAGARYCVFHMHNIKCQLRHLNEDLAHFKNGVVHFIRKKQQNQKINNLLKLTLNDLETLIIRATLLKSEIERLCPENPVS
jgi:hypothetical protein